MSKELERSTKQQVVLDAVKELHAQEQIVTRETLHEYLGLNYGPIDSSLSLLVDEGEIIRVQRGVYIPRPDVRPNRPISKTIIPGGWVKLEIGDDHVITLSPAESRALGELTAGAGQQFAAIELGHQAAILVGELSMRMLKLERTASVAESGLGVSGTVKELQRRVAKVERNLPQPELGFGE
ncbi:putative AbiEi antitoxin of type IV toxin-antitoxin system [Azomonas agilis]|uniref:Putative AbiEi antitoxin of type IV toxin-antitoxin system n=1 Tax=Azomonas agilis TaxID=116849 RepID=A0A562HYM4_9GAMM|nr:type IV toxin-antitoxin system AbiEi family antitoxin domain-containing protein [Azomonas agilis]TWH63879.1 putative AbiEi antitoxin of type IV toxin-antitoxin system [Azomonas agilis]